MGCSPTPAARSSSRVREEGLSIEWYDASGLVRRHRPARVRGRRRGTGSVWWWRSTTGRHVSSRRPRRSATPTPLAVVVPGAGPTATVLAAAGYDTIDPTRLIGAPGGPSTLPCEWWEQPCAPEGTVGSRHRRTSHRGRRRTPCPDARRGALIAVAVRSPPCVPSSCCPTYNEVENIAAMLAAVREAVPSADIIVVDDNSPDGTAAVAETVAAELGQIKLLHRPGKHGLGSAYRNGFTMALDEGYDRIVSMDVDFSHDPAVIPEMLRLIDAGAAAVIGSRYVPGGSTVNWSPHRRLLSRWGNRYTSFVLRLQIRDCTSGFRAYRADALRRDLAVDHDRRGLRVPHRARAAARAGRVQGDGDADRVHSIACGHVEDVRPHRRRVDAARHPLGPPRPLQA